MKRLITLSAVAASCLLISCTHEQPTLPVNFICQIDISQSRDTTVRQWYKATIQHSILAKMRAKDRAVILPVDGSSATSSQEIFKVDFSKNDYGNVYAGLQKKEIEQQNHLDSVHSAMQQFSVLFDAAVQKRAPMSVGTDLFGALAQGRKYIRHGYRNVIVLFSDMLHYTDKDKWNFEGHLNSKDEIGHYLSIAEKIDLKDVQIIVLCGAQNTIRPEKFNVIKSFWEQYFLACNGKLIDYSSGAVTKLEEIVGQ